MNLESLIDYVSLKFPDATITPVFNCRNRYLIINQAASGWTRIGTGISPYRAWQSAARHVHHLLDID